MVLSVSCSFFLLSHGWLWFISIPPKSAAPELNPWYLHAWSDQNQSAPQISPLDLPSPFLPSQVGCKDRHMPVFSICFPSVLRGAGVSAEPSWWPLEATLWNMYPRTHSTSSLVPGPDRRWGLRKADARVLSECYSVSVTLTSSPMPNGSALEVPCLWPKALIPIEICILPWH